MRLLSVRLIVSLILGVTLVSLFSTYYEVRREKQGLRNDLERRAEVLGESLVGNVEPYLDGRSLKQLQENRRSDSATGNTWLEWPSSTRGWNPLPQSSGLTQQLQNPVLGSSGSNRDNRKQSQFHSPGRPVAEYLCASLASE